MPDRDSPPETCANCGAAIPRRARACPDCGADERTGWRENSIYDGLELPDHAWQADADPGNPPPAGRRTPRVNGVPWLWWCVGLALLAVLVAGALALR
jgi:hypothetical protein